MELTKRQRLFVRILFGWLLFSTSAILALTWSKPRLHAAICMACGLVWLWGVVCGGLMWRFRRPIVRFVGSRRMDWRVRFVLFATLLAMVEEAITTTMTNCAPLFGVPVGQAYITASANYLDVVALHSVSVIISLFVGWAVLLHRYDFSPFAVFVLFGMTGTLAEMSFGGPQHITEYGMWAIVYGLMVWLPACTVPAGRKARPPRWWHYPLAVVAPFAFVALFPLAGVLHLFYPGHPKVHFPPM